jgi:cytochrome c oxidase subunit 2
VGTYTIQCFELCGAGHSNMKSRLVIMHPSEFQKWYGGG